MTFLLHFWALNVSVALLSMQGKKAWFHQKYLNMCSKDELSSYRFGTIWGWVINDRIFIFGWTIPLKPDSLSTIFLITHSPPIFYYYFSFTPILSFTSPSITLWTLNATLIFLSMDIIIDQASASTGLNPRAACCHGDREISSLLALWQTDRKREMAKKQEDGREMHAHTQGRGSIPEVQRILSQRGCWIWLPEGKKVQLLSQSKQVSEISWSLHIKCTWLCDGSMTEKYLATEYD